jgi:hypothetical protein
VKFISNKRHRGNLSPHLFFRFSVAPPSSVTAAPYPRGVQKQHTIASWDQHSAGYSVPKFRSFRTTYREKGCSLMGEPGTSSLSLPGLLACTPQMSLPCPLGPKCLIPIILQCLIQTSSDRFQTSETSCHF